VNTRAVGLASLATRGAAVLVLLLYAPAFDAPFLVPKFGALDIAASLGLVAYGLRRAAGGPAWSRPIVAAALLVLATTAIAWAAAAAGVPGVPYAVAAMARWVALFGVASGVIALSDDRAAVQALLEALTIASAVVAAIGLLQHLEALPFFIPVISKPGSTFGNRNLAAEAIAMALPLGVAAAVSAERRELRTALVASLALEGAYLAVTRARGAWIGAACGVAVVIFLARRRWSRKTIAIAGALALLAIVAAVVPGRFNPHDAGDTKRYSGVVEVIEGGLDARSTAVRTRVGLWLRTLRMIGDHPWLGVGPGNWPVIFPLYAEPGATEDGVLKATLEPRQAHDDMLERAAETGVVGLAALVFLGVLTGLAARRRLRTAAPGEDRSALAGASGSLLSLAVLSIPGFPLDMPATLTLAGIALGLVAAEITPSGAANRQGPSSRARIAAYAVAAVGLLFAVVSAFRTQASVRRTAWLGSAEGAEARGPVPAGDVLAGPFFERALAADSRDRRTLVSAAKSFLRAGHLAEADAAARGALRLEPYAPNVLALVASIELAAGDTVTARRDATRALTLLHDCPLALHTRALAATREGDADAAAADQLRLSALAAGADNDGTTHAARVLLHSPP
jgi:O-antigen ligase